MRLRFVVLASLLTALVAGIVPAAGTAAPRHNHGLTINAIPHRIQAGENVLVYGFLKGGTVGNQPIVLYQHLDGFGGGYTAVDHTTTDSRGFYEFNENGVLTNRNWFTRGPGHTHSRTVVERVEALVSPPTTSSSTIETNRRVVFTGTVTPPVHAGDRVLLQQQIGNSDDWRTIDSDRLNRASAYAIAHRFRVPGERDLRVVFRGDRRNTRSVSDITTINVEQRQVNGFTIKTSDPIIQFGQSPGPTISGVLSGTSSPVPVTLCSRAADHRRFTCNQVTMTTNNGNYSFTVSPPVNELYQVRTNLPPRRHTAVLFEGVKDIVSMSASSTTVPEGGTVTFTGNVTPDKAGHPIYLQRLGKDGDWHTVEVGRVKHDSSYQFSWTFGGTGTREFRARIPSDEHNVGAASDPVTITVTQAPASSLPPAS
jgi:hypothetical protein